MRQTVNASNSECVKQWSHAHWHDTDAISMQPSGDCVRHRRSTCQPAKSAYKSRPDFDGGKVTSIFQPICEYIRLVVTTLIIQVHKRHLIERMTLCTNHFIDIKEPRPSTQHSWGVRMFDGNPVASLWTCLVHHRSQFSCVASSRPQVTQLLFHVGRRSSYIGQ